MTSESQQTEGATPESQVEVKMECPLDGTRMGRHDWVWVYEDTPKGRVGKDRIRCNHCKEERRTSRAEGDVLMGKLS